MSADPLGGPLGGSIEHHAIVDAPPALDHHTESSPDFWIDSSNQSALDDHLRQIDQALAEAHGQTGLLNARANYGFTGVGQTVAVIDSGIAYDHFALGGGFGSNYRVVGGWDFTGENDADPYDDGPSGSHGTHVAGIVGGDSGNDTGVAPGVDLVALRVFDDAGAGYFSWVENALDWVHTNRNNFENPITAINLSLGVASWNAETVPSWANLEDEFAQLEADGIFIAVSAGNSYSSFNTTGLSYPAASSYVIPVMSTDDSGLMSYFSQRSSRAIAAPGRWITSTVPDYAGNNNGVTDDYATFSGTSMAAPYVAGASVIIREAMQFVGYTNITQDMIYDHMMATADSFFDSATNQSYSRLNVQAAIDALMPADDFGSTIASAYSLGTVSGPMAMSGAIATLSDIDYFSFTAANTGTVTFAATNTTNDLAASWIVAGSQSLGALAVSGDSVTVDVVAGQNYTVGFGSGDGLGYYDFDVTAESTFSFTDWGDVSFTQLQGVSATNDTWYRVAATSAGYLSVDTSFDGAAGQVSLEFYDSNLQLVDTGNAVNGTSRVDAYVSAGDELYVKVIGTNSDVDFRLTNLVSLNGTTVNVAGTAGDDVFSFSAGSNHVVKVNGVEYNFASIAITAVDFNGGSGSDSIVVYGSSENEVALMGLHSARLTSATYTVAASKIENIVLVGGGGQDTAYLYGSVGDDTYRTYGDRAVMSGEGYYNRASHFDATYGFANSVGDVAFMYGSNNNDTYRTYDDRVVMSGNGYYNRAIGFENSYGYADSPADVAWMYGSSGADTYRTYGDRVVMSGDGYYNRATGFATTWGYSNSSDDVAQMYGSAGSDQYRASSTHAVMSGTGFYNATAGFQQTYAYADSPGDQAWMYGSDGDDTFRTYDDRVVMSGVGYYNRATGFDFTYGYANSAGDTAWMYGSVGDDTYRTYDNRVVMSGQGYYNRATGFSNTYGYANSAGDIAWMYDSISDDTYRAYEDRAIMSGTGYYNRATGFSSAIGISTGGSDSAWLHDGTGDDSAVFRTWGAYLELTSGVRFDAQGFDTILAYGVNGGTNTVDEEAVDYYFEKIGDWA